MLYICESLPSRRLTRRQNVFSAWNRSSKRAENACRQYPSLFETSPQTPEAPKSFLLSLPPADFCFILHCQRTSCEILMSLVCLFRLTIEPHTKGRPRWKVPPGGKDSGESKEKGPRCHGGKREATSTQEGRRLGSQRKNKKVNKETPDNCSNQKRVTIDSYEGGNKNERQVYDGRGGACLVGKPKNRTG